MMIPLGRRRLVISLISPRIAPGPANTPQQWLAAESDGDFARLAGERPGVQQRARREIDQVLYAGPPMR